MRDALCSVTAALPRWLAKWPGRVALAMAMFAGSYAHAAPTLPEIRLSQSNPVPACVTPERLMAFLQRRNGNLSPRFRNIASFYKKHGEAWGVRWDYAFFQMAIETNFLTYRAPSGRMGDVDPKQNNFAGIGTTGGGVPGDSFPDVSTGVLGQIQHLVVYSGEMISNPVAPRTQLKQEHILAKSRELNRPVRFSDLAGRWAADRKYGGSIEWVAERFRTESCKGRAVPQANDETRAEAPAPKRVAQANAGVAVKIARNKESHAAEKKVAKKDEPALPKPAVTAQKTPAVTVQPVPQVAKVEAPAAAPAAVAEEPDARFALFTPPVGLANARISAPVAPVRPVTTTPVQAKPLEVQKPAQVEASAPDTTTAPEVAAKSVPQARDVTGEAPEPGTVEPSDTQVAVAGASVGGFMVGGPKKTDFLPPSGLGVKPSRCVVQTARYGGETTVLVKTLEGADVQYVALSVIEGFEDSMTKSFLASRGDGGEVLGTFPSREGALAKARILCPE
jgi:hypothetical protein